MKIISFLFFLLLLTACVNITTTPKEEIQENKTSEPIEVGCNTISFHTISICDGGNYYLLTIRNTANTTIESFEYNFYYPEGSIGSTTKSLQPLSVESFWIPYSLTEEPEYMLYEPIIEPNIHCSGKKERLELTSVGKCEKGAY